MEIVTTENADVLVIHVLVMFHVCFVCQNVYS